MKEFPHLHDATLISIEIDWLSGLAKTEIKAFDGVLKRKAILFKGIKNIVIPREFPWGESNSINSFQVINLDETKEAIIEMQSGDVIKIKCCGIEID